MARALETIALSEVRRGDLVKPAGWKNPRKVTVVRPNASGNGTTWLWFGSNVHWGTPESTVERVVS